VTGWSLPRGTTLYVGRYPGRLHLQRLRVVIHDFAHDGAAVETGGMLAAADLLMHARRQYRAEAIRGRSLVGLVALVEVCRRLVYRCGWIMRSATQRRRFTGRRRRHLSCVCVPVE
jgi:hypothetical protein